MQNKNNCIVGQKVQTHKNYAAVVGGSAWPPISSIQPTTRSRLLSESNKRRRTDEGDVPGSDTEVESLTDDVQTKDRSRRWEEVPYKKPSRNATGKSREVHSDVKKPNRPKATWGKSKVPASDDLSGPPPEIFMMNCRKIIEKENVIRHFESHGITLVEVKKASHSEARRNSFILTVNDRNDYNKILSGDLIPQDVGVRSYVPRPRNRNPDSGLNKDVNDFLRNSSIERTSLGSLGSLVSKQSISITPPILDTQSSQPSIDNHG